MDSFFFGFFFGSLALFFLSILLTIVFGGVSRVADKRVELEGRVSEGQRPPTDREDRDYHPYNPAHNAYHYV